MTEVFYRDEAADITLHLGDMRAVLPRLELAGRVVAVTDCPYNCGKNYGATTNDRQLWPEWCEWWDGCLELMAYHADDIFAFLSQTAAKKYARLGRHEWDWQLVWNKPLSLAVCAMPFMPHHEPICYWGVTRKKDLPKSSKRAGWGSDVLTHNVVPNIYGHPTEKPLPLMKELLSRFSSDTVILDPFAGSGTTLIAAKELGMRAVGVEVNPDYCEIIARRMGQFSPPKQAQNVLPMTA